MLILAREVNETVIIEVPPSSKPTRISMMLIESNMLKARFGFEAPLYVTVHREEVQQRIDRGERRRAGRRDR